MKITTRKNQDVTVLECSGTIEGATATQWRDAIKKELDGGTKMLLLHLLNVDGAGSDIEGVLNEIDRYLIETTNNATIALVLSDNLGRGMGASGIMDRIGVYASESEAIASSLRGADNSYGEDL